MTTLDKFKITAVTWDSDKDPTGFPKWMAGISGGVPDRGQMHYRAGLNMIPLLEWYRHDPSDENFVLLEIAMGAIGGQLTNIHPDGSTAMFFHAYPWVMDFDPHSGDYGLGFFGNALEQGSCLGSETLSPDPCSKAFVSF